MSTVLGTLIAGPKTQITLTRDLYRGEDRIDIRKYFLAGDGNWLPTQKGISLTIEQAFKVMEILQSTKVAPEDVK
jgi:hypothetical protein